MKLTGAAILVSRGMKVLQAAPAAYPYRSARESDADGSRRLARTGGPTPRHGVSVRADYARLAGPPGRVRCRPARWRGRRRGGPVRLPLPTRPPRVPPDRAAPRPAVPRLAVRRRG